LDGNIGHDGGIWGYAATMFQHPSSGVMIIITTNTSGTFATDSFAQLSALISSQQHVTDTAGFEYVPSGKAIRADLRPEDIRPG